MERRINAQGSVSSQTASSQTASSQTAKKSSKTAKNKAAKNKSAKNKAAKASRTRVSRSSQTTSSEVANSKPAHSRACEQQAKELAYQTIQKHFRASTQRLPAVLADQDPEELHQMRVSLRRLRTAIAILAPVLVLPRGVSDRRIAKLAKTLGAVRDLDVLQLWLGEYRKTAEGPQQLCPPELTSPAELKALKRVDKHLHRQRKKAMQTLRQRFEGKHYQSFVTQMEQWLTIPQFSILGELPVENLVPDLLLPLVAQLLLHPGWQVAVEWQADRLVPQRSLAKPEAEAERLQLLQSQGKHLHALRKQTKQLRYQAELFEACFDNTYCGWLDELKLIQGLLGAFQDEVVLSQFLVEALGDRWQDKLPQLDQFFQQQHQQRWQQWQALQNKYLDPQFQRELRRLLIQVD